MKKEKIILNEGEKIVFKASNVRQGFWGAYTNNLIITSQCVMIEKYGLFNNYKGTERIDYSNIKQAIKGKAFNDENQLEIYMTDGKIETFALQSGNLRALKVLILAINDQMSEDAEYYDYSFYQRMIKPMVKSVEIIEPKSTIETNNNVDNSSFLKKTTMNIAKSKKITPKSITKGLIKAGMENSSFKKTKDNICDDLGIYDIQDTFIDLGNDFRDLVGLKPKMTNAERLKLEKKNQNINKASKPREKKKNYSFEEQLEIERSKIKTTREAGENKLSDDQIEYLRKIKNLFDEGILTQEEFENKKRNILD